jgi:hypothetical protein
MAKKLCKYCKKTKRAGCCGSNPRKKRKKPKPSQKVVIGRLVTKGKVVDDPPPYSPGEVVTGRLIPSVEAEELDYDKLTEQRAKEFDRLAEKYRDDYHKRDLMKRGRSKRRSKRPKRSKRSKRKSKRPKRTKRKSKRSKRRSKRSKRSKRR